MSESNIITRDFNGNPFDFREDGYFNMTRAAKHFGKRVDHFLANEGTQEYLVAMEKTLLNNSNSGDQKLVSSTWGNGKSPHVGTWAHPKLAVFFARWLDTRFAVWCDFMIDDILAGHTKIKVSEKSEAAKVPVSFADALRMAADLEEEKQKKLNAAVIDRDYSVPL